MTGYRIEWEVAWNPKKTEQECYDYIEKRYPNAVYTEWVKNVNGEPTKRCYADADAQSRDELKCEIIQAARKKKKSQVESVLDDMEEIV